MSVLEHDLLGSPKAGTDINTRHIPSRTFIEIATGSVLTHAAPTELLTMTEEYTRLQAVVAELAINDYSRTSQ